MLNDTPTKTKDLNTCRGNYSVMVSLKTKKIKGREYLYAEYSFRLPDGRIKKLSKLIKKRDDKESKEIKDYFFKKEIESYQSYALKKYKTDSVLPEEKIKEIESIKIKHKHLIRNLTKNQMKDVLDRFTINFTYESNAIEGNSLTLKDVTFILTENITPKGKNLREIYETRNTKLANELLFHNKIKITIKDIIKLHSVLIKDTGVQEGFKKVPNFLLMRDVKTTPPEKVEEEMKSLVEWYDQAKKEEHPIRIAASFHGRFERVHPFEDGNGRVGRILINAILVENGYPPLIIRKTMKTSYFSALESYDKGYKTKLERFVLEKFERTFKNFFQIYVNYL